MGWEDLAVLDPQPPRRDYHRGHLDETTVADSWTEQFRRWFADADAALHGTEVNAMQVATVDGAGRPSVRTVLLKGYDERGVVFYTNYRSAKGRDLAGQPYAAAVLAWLALERQVRFAGPVEPVARAETAAYFATRPRGSQLGAWASPQSRVIASREALDAAGAEVAERFAGQERIPPPEHWGGFRIAPESVEFWQGRTDRLHDRLRYRRDPGSGAGWTIERLAP